MNRPSSAARKFIGSFELTAIVNPGPCAANDNDDDRFDALALDVVAILLRDGREMLAG